VDSNTALLVIDTQVNMFDPQASVYEPERVLRVVGSLIGRAHTQHIPVVFIRNNGGEGDPDLPHTPGWEIDPRLGPGPGDAVVDKTRPDSFYETPLQNLLTERNIHNLIISGLQTDYCVNATTRRAVELGYAVTVAADGHSTYPSSTLTAAQLIEQHNSDFAKIATVVPAQDIKLS